MTTPARLSRTDRDDLSVTVSGPSALDDAVTLDPGACELRVWSVKANQSLAELPEVAIGTQDVWYRTEAAGGNSYRLLLSGPQAEGGVAVDIGIQRTWVRVTDGRVVIVRPAGRLRVRVAPERRSR